jgi:hypothetical protein
VWRVFRPEVALALPAGESATAGAATATREDATTAVVESHSHVEVATLAFAYGLAGFGYIVTATFLPVIARSALPGSAWLDMFWPIFGVGVILGALLATRVRVSGDLRLVLGGAYVIQAAGIGIGLLAPTTAGFAIGSFLLGLPFTAITYFAMQEVRRLRPQQLSGTTGLVTATWSIGQTLGPPMVAVLLGRIAAVGDAFALSLLVAAGVLMFGAVAFFAASRLWPLSSARPPAAAG